MIFRDFLVGRTVFPTQFPSHNTLNVETSNFLAKPPPGKTSATIQTRKKQWRSITTPLWKTIRWVEQCLRTFSRPKSKRWRRTPLQNTISLNIQVCAVQWAITCDFMCWKCHKNILRLTPRDVTKVTRITRQVSSSLTNEPRQIRNWIKQMHSPFSLPNFGYKPTLNLIYWYGTYVGCTSLKTSNIQIRRYYCAHTSDWCTPQLVGEHKIDKTAWL